MESILCNQYVANDLNASMGHQVRIGSGMGMTFSGEIADSAFLQNMEIDFILKDSVRSEYGIIFYVRFKDDIFIVLDGSYSLSTRQRLWSEMKNRADFFKLVIERVSRQSVSMLDTEISIIDIASGFFKLASKPYFKASSMHTILSSQSAHPVGIHLSWPSARLKTFVRLSSRKSDSREAKRFFLEQMLQNCSDHISSNDILYPAYSMTPLKSRDKNSWIVLPFHPIFEKSGISKLCRRL